MNEHLHTGTDKTIRNPASTERSLRIEPFEVYLKRAEDYLRLQMVPTRPFADPELVKRVINDGIGLEAYRQAYHIFSVSHKKLSEDTPEENNVEAVKSFDKLLEEAEELLGKQISSDSFTNVELAKRVLKNGIDVEAYKQAYAAYKQDVEYVNNTNFDI